MRLGILTSHPIQYYSPWFRALAKQVDLEVFYAHKPEPAQRGAGFGKSFEWDVDLLSGYKYSFLKNISRRPGVDHFAGCDTPEIREIILRSRDNQTTGQQVSGQSSVVHQRFDAFIVVGWYLKTFMQAARACRQAGVPILVRGDSQLRTPRPWLKRLAMEVRQRWLLRQFDGFLYVGRRNREYLAHYGAPSEKMFFAPHFVDNDFFKGKAETLKSRKAEIRKQWEIAEDGFCVLFCGKFIPKKRPMDLVEAARILTVENAKESSKRPVHLLFVGSGELGGPLRASCNVVSDAEWPVRSQKLNSKGQRAVADVQTSDLRPPTSGTKPPASFAGFLNQSELPAAYVAADVLVLPSDGGETWGLVVNEAMACGLPAIISNAVGCAPDLVDEGKTGFTYPMGNVAALAEQLKRLAEMQGQNFSFASALTKKLTNYSVETAIYGTTQAMHELARL